MLMSTYAVHAPAYNISIKYFPVKDYLFYIGKLQVCVRLCLWEVIYSLTLNSIIICESDKSDHVITYLK
jgi:hypothetical protein